MYEWMIFDTLNDVKKSCTWNLKPSGNVMNFEVETRNGILLLMQYGLKIILLERHHIILRKVIMSYLCLYCKVDLVDLLGSVNVIRL